jgi:hypothetical protein
MHLQTNHIPKENIPGSAYRSHSAMLPGYTRTRRYARSSQADACKKVHCESTQ